MAANLSQRKRHAQKRRPKSCGRQYYGTRLSFLILITVLSPHARQTQDIIGGHAPRTVVEEAAKWLLAKGFVHACELDAADLSGVEMLGNVCIFLNFP